MTVARMTYEHDVKYPAAAIAYYAFVSFIPLLLLVFGAVGEPIAMRIYTAMPQFLTPAAQQLVYDATTAASEQIGAVLLAIVVLTWSGANVAVGFQTVVERVEDVTRDPLPDRIRDAVAVLGSLGLAMVSIIFTSTFFVLPPADPLAGFLGLAALFIVLTASFLPLYYVPSHSVTSPSEALPGAATVAFGWTILHTAVHFYAVNADRYAVYGVLSGIIVILTSLYLAAVVLMVGVVVNATLTDGIDALRPPLDGRR